MTDNDNHIWLEKIEKDKFIAGVFPTIGRLLYICQKFENNCMRIAKDIQFWAKDDLFSNNLIMIAIFLQTLMVEKYNVYNLH